MFDKTLKKFWNCYLLKGDQIVKEDLWVRAGRVVDAASLFFEEETAPGEDLDCGGHLIAPGFIDLQINGGFGVDFSHDLKGPCPDCLDDIDDHGHKAHVEQRLARVARGLLAHGKLSELDLGLVTVDMNVVDLDPLQGSRPSVPRSSPRFRNVTEASSNRWNRGPGPGSWGPRC